VDDADELFAALSHARLRSYLAEAENDRERALELYEWNLRLSGALWIPVGITEVALRNAMSAAISREARFGYEKWPTSVDFRALISDPRREQLESPLDSAVRTATKVLRARHSSEERDGAHRVVTANDVIADLNFGFWARLLDRRLDQELWRTTLHTAFVPKSSRPALQSACHRIRQLRNRLAHHEPVWAGDLHGVVQDVDFLLKRISPSVAAWASKLSQVESELARRPDWLFS
jgi:hypothetical protein